MATSQLSEVLQHLRRTVLLRDGAGLTDGQLLEDYISCRDEAALAALVRRHGPMVWGACRRVLRNYHDAEDAFQATFLVLVRKAASIVPRELVANWLYWVAHRTALKARAMAAGRKGRERQVPEMPEPDVAQAECRHDLQHLLDEELARLPHKYRVVLVLCDLEGKTRKEAARQLGVPEGTVAGWLARARTMLAKRLARHSLAVSGEAWAAMLSPQAASACVPPAVVSSTINAASLYAAGQAAAERVISAQVAALTEGVLKAMFLNRLKGVLVALVVVAGLVGGSIYLLPTYADEKRTELTIPLNEPEASKSRETDFNKTILAMEAKFWAAGLKFDADAMQQIYADDFTAFSERGRSDKAACVEATRQYRSANLKFRNIEIIRLNKDAAIITYRLDQDVFARDGTLVVKQRNCRMSNSWVRRDGGWVLVFSQMTQMP
jgi:RNA polymerase sigma factor (sigma-70 family)